MRQNNTYIFTLLRETSDDAAFYPNWRRKNVESWFRRLATIYWMSLPRMNYGQEPYYYYYFPSRSERIIALCHQTRAEREKSALSDAWCVSAFFWHLWFAPAGKTLYKGGHVAPQRVAIVANTIPKAARNYIEIIYLSTTQWTRVREWVGMAEGKWFTGRTWWLWERHTRAHQWKEKKRWG